MQENRSARDSDIILNTHRFEGSQIRPCLCNLLMFLS